MCGRCKLETPPADLARYFGIEDFQIPEWAPRTDVPPTMPLPVVRMNAHHKRALSLMRWGILPLSAKEPKTDLKTFNATIEKLVTPRSLFYPAAKSRRCLVAADGFYEWPIIDGKKQKQFISTKTKEPMAFAGLYQAWYGPELTIDCCTIITTASRGTMAAIHDRMPIVLPREAWDTWLDTVRLPVERLREVLPTLQEEDLLVSPCEAEKPRPEPVAPRDERQLRLF